MKNLVFVFLTLLLSNIAYAAYVSEYAIEGVEVIDDEPELPPYFDDKDCYNGGYDASHCSIDAGIDVGVGISAKCDVTCVAGTYACCGLRCICKRYNQN